MSTEIVYDELDRPRYVDVAIDGTPTLSQAYTYDENGNLATSLDDAGTATFTYDDLDRLTDAVFPGGQTYAYAYDAVGNLTGITKPGSSPLSLTYDLADRITTSGYAYDDNGALTADPVRTYAHDAFGRLTGATVGATTTAYSLDGAGRRLAQTSGVTTTSFDLDLRGQLATLLGDGTRRYLPGDPSAGYEQAGTWYSALTDQLGSPHSTISQSGVQSAITRWDPFGAVRPGSSVSTGIGFAGEWRDPAGLIDLRARAYDPAVGRFTSRDTFGGLGVAPQTANRYSYALNGPYRYADPSGRFVAAITANAPLLLSIAIQSTPIVGDAYSALTGLIGYDPIAGVSLSSEERALALGSALVIGGGFHLLTRVADRVVDGAKLGRAGDAGNALRGGQDGSVWSRTFGSDVADYAPPGVARGQITDSSCVAASCRMVADSTGRADIGEAAWRAATGTTSDGATLRSAARALNDEGIASSYRTGMTIDDLAKATARGPAIAAGRGHALVVDNVERGMVYIRDPLDGGVAYSVEIDQFIEWWSSRAVTLN